MGENVIYVCLVIGVFIYILMTDVRIVNLEEELMKCEQEQSDE